MQQSRSLVLYIVWSLLGLFAVIVLTACGVPQPPKQTISTQPQHKVIPNSKHIPVPEGFRFETVKTKPVQLTVRRSDGTPAAFTKVNVYNDDKKLVLTTQTDANGQLDTEVKQMIGRQNLHLIPFGVGVLQEPIPLNVQKSEGGLSSMAQPLLTMPTVDSSGKPSVLEPNENFSSTFIQDVNRAFPEGVKVHLTNPEYLSSNYDRNILVKEDGEVFISFVHEGAGYKNTFGYFTYPDGQPPTNTSQINKIVVFPNTSYSGSGGSLTTGDTVKLGRFTKGTRIGFFVIANGWTGTRVDENRATYYSLQELNPEYGNQSFGQHVAVLWHPQSSRLVLGIEDINRLSSNCDHDFNDVMFTLRSNPVTAVDTSKVLVVPEGKDADNDGVDDANDKFPNDPKKAFIRYYPSQNSHVSIAFEDLFPALGDYDFNDLVVKYSSEEHLDPDLKLRSVKMNYEIVAVGAGYPSGLGVLFETTPSNVESFILLRNNVQVQNAAIEPGHTNEVVVRIFDNARKEIPMSPGYDFANTPSGSSATQGNTFTATVTFKAPITGDSSPFNPFLFRTSNRGHEVHLLGKRPSELFSSGYFGTKDDRTQTSQKNYFTGVNGFPWAMILDSTWEHPIERTDISTAYTNFSLWVQSGGKQHQTWMRDTPKTGKTWKRK